MRKVLVGGILAASATALTGCGGSGLNGSIEACRPEFQSSTPATDEELATMFNNNHEAWSFKIEDSTSSHNWNTDYVDTPGEAVCRLEDDSLVFTVSGLALRQAIAQEGE